MGTGWPLERKRGERVRLSGMYEWATIRDLENPRWSFRCPLFLSLSPPVSDFALALHNSHGSPLSRCFFSSSHCLSDVIAPPANRVLSYADSEMTPLSLSHGLIGRRE